MDLVKLIYSVVTRRAACRVVGGRLRERGVATNSEWANLAGLAGRIPGHKRPTLAWVKEATGSAAASLSFPFNAPGYVIEPVRSKRGTAFDVVRCPVAEYFREQGATDLCVAAWCNLDFALGEATRTTLTRTKTLVEGSDRCDFRVQPRD